MIIDVRYQTSYRYDSPAQSGLQRLNMRPKDSVEQVILDWQLTVSGGSIEASYQDHYGNLTDLVRINDNASEVIINSQGRAQTKGLAGIHGRDEPSIPAWVFFA